MHAKIRYFSSPPPWLLLSCGPFVSPFQVCAASELARRVWLTRIPSGLHCSCTQPQPGIFLAQPHNLGWWGRWPSLFTGPWIVTATTAEWEQVPLLQVKCTFYLAREPAAASLHSPLYTVRTSLLTRERVGGHGGHGGSGSSPAPDRMLQISMKFSSFASINTSQMAVCLWLISRTLIFGSGFCPAL